MGIRVLPATPDMLRLLRHPNGTGFVSMKTPAEWPADQFTYRRIREGAVKEYDDSASRPKAKVPTPKAKK